MTNLEPATKKGLIFIAILGVVLVALAIILFRQGDRQLIVKYEKELALAKDYRMVVDEEDLRKFNPKIPDSENAALVYMKLSPKMTTLAKVNSLTPSTTSTDSLLTEIRNEVTDADDDLKLLDEAAKLEKFWVDLSFYRGEGSIMVNHSKVYVGTQFLLARALLAKLEGNESSALKDLRTISNIAGHFYGSNDEDKFDLADEISWMKAEFLAAWAAEKPPGSIWHRELKTLAENYVVPGPRDLATLGLYYDLAAIESTRSRESRAKHLGMKDSEESTVSGFDVARYANRGFEASKLKIIEGWRTVWVEIEKGDYANPGVIRIGDEMISEGLRSNPWLSSFEPIDRIYAPDVSEFRLRKLALQVASRILGQEDRTKAPSMAGLQLIRHSTAPTISYHSRAVKIVCYDSRSRRPDLTLTIPLQTP